MNIFEVENLVKQIEKENIRFPRISKPNGFQRVNFHKSEEPELVKLNITEHFETDESISALIYIIEQQVIKNNSEFLYSCFYEMLEKYGVNKDELLERVSMQVTGITNHIFIDGDYAFSFRHGCDWAENGQSYTTWFKPEYFSEMSRGIL